MYALGAVGYFYMEFSDPETGALTDPSTVRFKYETPGGVETTLTYPDANLIKRATGRYRAAVTLPTSGTWTFRWEPAGEAGETEFQRDVATSRF